MTRHVIFNAVATGYLYGNWTVRWQTNSWLVKSWTG